MIPPSEADFAPYRAASELPGGNVLVLAPHPDDEVIGCGGAILQHRRQDDLVTVVVATNGTAAQPHADVEAQEAYGAKRRAESRAAARVLGYDNVVFWGATDRHLGAWPALQEQLSATVREVAPATIYAPSPYEIHPDHHALAAAVCQLASRLDPATMVVFYEVGWPLPPNLLLDITADRARKRQALECFASQLAIQDYLRHMEALNVYRTYTLPASVAAAEGYLALTVGELQTDPLRCFGRSRLTDHLRSGSAVRTHR